MKSAACSRAKMRSPALSLRLLGVIALAILSLPARGWARELQVIYTNDLHSYLESSEFEGWGGYAAIKATIDRVRAEGATRGLESVVLDAGDFSEGSPFFFADKGRQSWRIIDQMGYDAVTVGNHDWLIGAGQMNDIFAQLKPRTPFLAANLKIDKKFPALKAGLRPWIELNRGGLKIAVLGVTTDELVYRWRMNGGGIDPAIDLVKKHAPALKARNDLVIGLTHIGVMEDIKLVGKTRGLDLVVGGHSHTKLEEPLQLKNADQVVVPVAQSGEHGQWVGALVLDVNPGEPVRVLSSRMIPVHAADNAAPEAGDVLTMVRDARTQLEERYSPEWLYDTVGTTSIPIERPITSYTHWGNFVMETLRQAAGADIAIDPGEFHGTTQRAGVITHETIMKSYPRVFEVENTMGWTLWKVRVPGWAMKLMLEYVTNDGLHLNVAGITFDTDSSSGKVKVSNLRVNGSKVKPFRNYTVAVTEGIGRGALEISFLLRLAFAPRNTGLPLWSILSEKLRQTGGSFGDRSYLTPAEMGGLP